MNWTINQTVDLSRGYTPVVWPDALMVSGDVGAHTWRVTVLDNGVPADLSGANITGNFLRDDGATVQAAGSVLGNVASVTLTDACYAVEGKLVGTMRAVIGGATVTLAAVVYTVKLLTSGDVVDPGVTYQDFTIDASPAGTYADLAALISANPDHSKIYITLDDGNWCYHNGSAWVAGGVYQAIFLEDGSATWAKRTPVGSAARICLFDDSTLPNIDTSAKTLTLYRGFIVDYGYTRDHFIKQEGFADIVIDYSAIIAKVWLLIYNITTYAFRAADYYKHNTLGQNEVALAWLTFDATGRPAAVDGLKVTVNGRRFDPLHDARLLNRASDIEINTSTRTVTITSAALQHPLGRTEIASKSCSTYPNRWESIYYDYVYDNLVAAWYLEAPKPGYVRLFSIIDGTKIIGLENYTIDGVEHPLTGGIGEYKVPAPSGDYLSKYGGYTDMGATYLSLTHTDIYAMYDSLMAAYPDYIARTIANTIVTNLGTLEIRYYTLKPVQPVGSDNIPKIIIVTGQHGGEKSGMLSVYNSIRAVCEDWRTDPLLRYLRKNYEIIVFPCLNAWGVNNNTRKNYNGVDLNRNYTTNWTLGPDPLADTYGGVSALSETETQCVNDVIHANLDASLLVDVHSFGTISGDQMLWISSPTAGGMLIGTDFVRNMTALWQAEYPTVKQDEIAFGYADGGAYGNGTLSAYAQSLGITGQTFEVGDRFNVIAGSSAYDEVSQQHNEEAFINFILMMAR